LPEVHYNLGALCLQRKNLVRAEVEFKKVLELLPTQREAFVALSRVYEEKGEREKALEVLKQATVEHKDDVSILYDLGILYLNLGRREEAEATLQRVEALDPARIGVQYALATAAVNRGDVPEAVRRLEKYVASAPEGAPNLETAKKLLAELKKAAPTSR
jgi:tetratricopeptide (TPR) repeat protein